MRFQLILKEGKYIMLFLLSLLVLSQQEMIAQDTLAAPAKSKKVLKLSSMKATMMAAALPGSGQIYNRKYWKIPLVYAGFGGIGYFVVNNSSMYSKYTKAYQDFTDKVPSTDSYINLIRGMDPERYDPVLHPATANASDIAWVKDGLKRQIDYYRKYRDLSYLGIAAWYIISILDANVDASLSDYDIGENINVAVAPVQVPGYYFATTGVNVSLRINF
jgi:hypothetical protein